MLAYAPKPIRRISVIGLAPMHNAMNERSRRIPNILRDDMRRIEMVVPQEHQCADEVATFALALRIAEQVVQALFQLRLGFNSWPRIWPKLRRFGSLEQFLNLLFGYVIEHARELSSIPILAPV